MKKAEWCRIDAFKLWCWRRLLRVLWTVGRSNQSPKGNQFWLFIGRTDAEAETPILWPPDAKNWLIGKDPDAGKDWGQEEKGMTDDEMVGWHHRLNGHGFRWTPGVGDEQGGHPIILSSVVPFSSCPQSFPASGSFQMSQLFASGGQRIGVSFLSLFTNIFVCVSVCVCVFVH